MMETIYFYSNKQEYKEFSNMYLADITIDGITYKSVENYYQATKYRHIPWLWAMIKQASPKFAQCLANLKTSRWSKQEERDQIAIIRKRLRTEGYILCRMGETEELKKFHENKLSIMLLGVRAKFMQNKKLSRLLLGTADRDLKENSPVDYFWGIGKDGTGENNLGKILMRVRHEIASMPIREKQ